MYQPESIDPTPGNTPGSTPGNTPSITAELRRTLDRAREERLRLTRVIKTSPGASASSTVDAGRLAEKVAELSRLVGRLDDAMTRRQRKLEALDERIGHRLDRLAQLEQSVNMLGDKLAGQVETVRDFSRLIASARDRGGDASAAQALEIVADPASPIPFKKRIDGLVAARRDEAGAVVDADRLIDSMQQLAARATRANAPRQVLEFHDPDGPAAA